MKLYQVICEALDSVQNMPISANQKDKLVATKLRGYLLSIDKENRSHIFERFKNERVFGRPLFNWFLEEELLYCASTYLDMVVCIGVTSLNNLQFDRSIFLNLIQQRQYHKLLRIIEHFKTETTNYIQLFFKNQDYQALFYNCSPQTVFNSAYLSLLTMALFYISFADFSKLYFLNIYDVLSNAQVPKSKTECAHEKISNQLKILHRTKDMLQQFTTEERPNKAKLQTSDENISPNSSPEKQKTAPTTRLDCKSLLQKADHNIAELESLLAALAIEITQESKSLPEAEKMRKVLIFNCKQVIERKTPICDQLVKNYEKAALTLRQMR